MGERIRALDWSKTPLGPVDGWPQSLRSALSHLLPSKAQISMFWGPELVTFYNDAYSVVLGGKHPAALGMPLREAWPELWSAGLKELFDSVLGTGEAFWAQDRPFFLERHGYLEETYFDLSYDPIRDESGRVSGVFCIVTETTGRVVGERRLRLLRDLGGIAQQASSVSDVFTTAATVLARDPEISRSPFSIPEPATVNRRRWWAPAASRPVIPSHRVSSVRANARSGRSSRRWRSSKPRPWRGPVRCKQARGPSRSHRSPSCRVRRAGSRPRRGSSPESARAGGPMRRTATSCGWSAPTSRRRWRWPAAPRTSAGAPRCCAADRAKTTFFSNVSHELRTPLTLIAGPIEDLLQDTDEPLGDAQREQLEIARRSARRLQKLVNSLLDFARMMSSG